MTTTGSILGTLATERTKFVDALGQDVIVPPDLHERGVAPYWHRLGWDVDYRRVYRTLTPLMKGWIWDSEIVFEVDDD